MNTIVWLISRIIQFFFGKGQRREGSAMPRVREAGAHEDRSADKSRNFDADYRAATIMLKTRMGNSYPDNYHARPSAGTNSTRDFGDERAEAIDTASAAIAAALRKGATVKQAAEAGAASVGI
ncbi:hypothetical protein MKK75_08205 [Methylobacterium sp. J-030]|uniref:hypothetical protein n=1 Tax=Methylobacterium sp. J-030 TaxID=2836627 RepID=UPI001FBB1D6C|nr:hypothetical protein [Methylobacterium sp. J-030]MCJ2068783.1 hypothetical protein [Methylobacterium sp. J-030]